MSDFVYWAVVAAGGVTLVIEAYRNFNTPNAKHPFELHPILKKVEVRNLCSSGEIIAGFIFYASIYLFIYLVILSSAEIYGLLVDASRALKEIGAIDNVVSFDDKQFGIGSAELSKPILVSALIISFLSIGAVRPVELTIRNIAQRLAGVPSGVFKVIDNLGEVPFDQIANGQVATRVVRFKEAAESIFKVEEFAPARQDIIFSLSTIDCLYPAVNRDGRRNHFPIFRLNRLSPLLDQLGGDIRALDESLNKFVNSATKTNALTSDDRAALLETLSEQAALARSNTMAIFAVLYIQNNRSVFTLGRRLNVADFGPHTESKPTDTQTVMPKVTTPATKEQSSSKPGPDPIATVKNYIQASYNSEQNSFAIAMLAALVLSSFILYALYTNWYGWYAQANTDVYATELAAINKDKSALAHCGLPTTDQVKCFDIAAREKWLQNQRGEILDRSVWDQIRSLALCCVCVLFAIVGRAVRLDQQSWQTSWRFDQFPFLRLLSMSLVPAIAAIFVTAAVALAQLWWDVSFRLTQSQIIWLFQSQSHYFVLQFGSGLILSLGALIIMDKHDSLSPKVTVGIAACVGLLYGLYAYLVAFVSGRSDTLVGAWYSRATHESLLSTALPVLFMVLFAIALEVTELGVAAKKKEALQQVPGWKNP